jgi:hypothetical protein
LAENGGENQDLTNLDIHQHQGDQSQAINQSEHPLILKIRVNKLVKDKANKRANLPKKRQAVSKKGLAVPLIQNKINNPGNILRRIELKGRPPDKKAHKVHFM